MRRVYLDWGVVSNLKKPELAEVRSFLLSQKQRGLLFFVYSPAHFEDAMRSKGDERLKLDIEMLESLVDNHLIAYSKKTAHPFLKTPSEYYYDNIEQDLNSVPDITELRSSIDLEVPSVGRLLKTVLDQPYPIPAAAREQDLYKMMLPDLPEFPTFNDVVHSSVVFINKMLNDKDYYKAYRSAVRATGFKLDSNAGNWNASEVIPNISDHLRLMGINKSFDEYIVSGFGNKGQVDDFQRFISAYYILDMIGYKSDKLPKASNAMTDAEHAFYAAFCDYLITQDKHLASKAQALYLEFGISTKIISPAEAMPILVEKRNDDLVSYLKDQIRVENVERREERVVVYKLNQRFLGVFSHCMIHDQDESTLLEFVLEFDNYSYFIFYDEARIMVDVIADYLGRPPKEQYESIREQIVSGDVNASIKWTTEDGLLFTLKADSENHRPKLFLAIPLHYNSKSVIE